jgi:hypothetical protein
MPIDRLRELGDRGLADVGESGGAGSVTAAEQLAVVDAPASPQAGKSPQPTDV